MSVAAEIERKLTAALQPVRVQVIDESELHKGHAGHRPGGQSHFRVEVVAAAFEGQSRVARQRRVYEILADALKAGVHPLALKTMTPSEDSKETQTPLLSPPRKRGASVSDVRLPWIPAFAGMTRKCLLTPRKRLNCPYRSPASSSSRSRRRWRRRGRC